MMCMAAQSNGMEVVQPNTNCNWIGVDSYQDSGKGTSCAHRKEYWIARGYKYGQIEREVLPTDVCEGFKYGTMLRDPVKLALSEINFVHRLLPKLTKDSALKKFRRELIFSDGKPTGGQGPEWKFLDNFQTRLFANAFDVPAGGITENHVLRAKATLRKFDIVARLDDLDKTSVREKMIQELGWHNSRALETRYNTSPQAFNFNESETEEFKKRNRYDYELFLSVDPVSLKMK